MFPPYTVQVCFMQKELLFLRRGCQPPWYNFKELDLPVCKGIDTIQEKFVHGPVGTFEEKDWTRPKWSTNGLATDFNCRVPCTNNKYQ
jgi:hypothetical protein